MQKFSVLYITTIYAKTDITMELRGKQETVLYYITTIYVMTDIIFFFMKELILSKFLLVQQFDKV